MGTKECPFERIFSKLWHEKVTRVAQFWYNFIVSICRGFVAIITC